MLVRDARGRFRAARMVHVPNLVDPLLGEAIAAREGCLFACDLGFDRIEFKGDSKQLVQLIQRQTEEHSRVAMVLLLVVLFQRVFSAICLAWWQWCCSLLDPECYEWESFLYLGT